MNAASPRVPLASPMFKDRRTGLLVFGILEILFGAMAAMMVPLMIFGQTMAARAQQGEIPLRQLIPGAMVYLVAGGVLIGLGIGSILGRT